MKQRAPPVDRWIGAGRSDGLLVVALHDMCVLHTFGADKRTEYSRRAASIRSTPVRGGFGLV